MRIRERTAVNDNPVIAHQCASVDDKTCFPNHFLPRSGKHFPGRLCMIDLNGVLHNRATVAMTIVNLTLFGGEPESPRAEKWLPDMDSNHE